jgi:hypothetical protein
VARGGNSFSTEASRGSEGFLLVRNVQPDSPMLALARGLQADSAVLAGAGGEFKHTNESMGRRA